MKVFVATKLGQKMRASDFNFCEEGDLLMFGIDCERDRNDIDGGCGCRRSLVSMSKGTGTTTFTVRDLPLSEEEYAQKWLEAIRKQGWSLTPDDERDVVTEAKELVRVAGHFSLGAVIEKRGNQFGRRNLAHKSN